MDLREYGLIAVADFYEMIKSASLQQAALQEQMMMQQMMTQQTMGKQASAPMYPMAGGYAYTPTQMVNPWLR